MKKKITETHGERISTLTEELAKKNEGFQKLQENASKQIQDLDKNFYGTTKTTSGRNGEQQKRDALPHEKNL